MSTVLALGFAAQAMRIGYPLEREIWLLRATGYAALGALFLSLGMTPMRRLTAFVTGNTPRAAPWLALRRTFGITSALWGLVHGILAFGTTFANAWAAVLAWPHTRAGVATLAILLPLLLTSFPRVVGRLRLRLWTVLHRLVYLAPIFLFLHVIQSPFAPRQVTLVLFGLLLVTGLLRFLPSRRRATATIAGSSTAIGSTAGETAPNPRH